jgi:hypothetical protein
MKDVNKELSKIGILKVTFFSDQPFEIEDDNDELMSRIGIPQKRSNDDTNKKFYLMDGYIMMDKITRFMKVAVYKTSDVKKRGKSVNTEISIMGVFFQDDSYEQILMEDDDLVRYYTHYKQIQLNPFKNIDN